MGRTSGNKMTFPYLAKAVGFVEPDQVVATAEAVVKFFRDHGNRADRKRARLKYVREGELLYIVTLPEAPVGAAAGAEPDPWYDQLWTNVRSIDDPVVP